MVRIRYDRVKPKPTVCATCGRAIRQTHRGRPRKFCDLCRPVKGSTERLKTGAKTSR